MFTCSTRFINFEYLNNLMVICNDLFSAKNVKMLLKYSYNSNLSASL